MRPTEIVALTKPQSSSTEAPRSQPLSPMSRSRHYPRSRVHFLSFPEHPQSGPSLLQALEVLCGQESQKDAATTSERWRRTLRLGFPQLRHRILCRIQLRSTLKWVVFVIIHLGASICSALSMHMHYASWLVCKLRCRRGQDCAAWQVIPSHVTPGTCSKYLQPSAVVLRFLWGDSH